MNVKQKRKEKNLTQLELAEKLKVSQGAVSQWELGLTFPATPMLLALSKVLDCSIDDLLKGGDDNADTTRVSDD